MSEPVRVGIIICDRYRTCAGGTCLRALRNPEGAFATYAGRQVELVGDTTCNGCPGGNLEYAPEEMKKNGAPAIHLATGLLAGYPPRLHIEAFRRVLPEKHGIEVALGTRPIPERDHVTHRRLGSWEGPEWEARLRSTLCDQRTRRAYD